VEVIIGARSSDFGPLILFGLGGIYTEIMQDVAFGLAPLSRAEARTMIDAVKSRPILAGARGGVGVDLDLLAETICRVGRLMTDFPQLRELDVNPLVAGPNELLALDARATLAEPGLRG
jgi:acetyltransferase